MQFEQLHKEYQDAAAGLFRGKTVTVRCWMATCMLTSQRVRSLPSIGLKSMQKRRVCDLFCFCAHCSRPRFSMHLRWVDRRRWGAITQHMLTIKATKAESPSPIERPTSPGANSDSKDIIVREGRIVSATLVRSCQISIMHDSCRMLLWIAFCPMSPSRRTSFSHLLF